jgi:peptidoglycan/LPS O-acetylase OafA/YrhL
MLHHHGQYYDVLYSGRRPLAIDFGPGHFGVELFFIISGFVILMTTERKKTVRAFVISRLTRLMPAFLVALLLATAILALAPMPPLNAPTLRQFLANLTMAPGLFGEPGVDLPYWTLTYELVFYAYIALALRVGALPAIEWFGLLWMALGYLFLVTQDVQHHHRSAVLLLAYYSNFFLIGMCLFRIYAGAARPITYGALVVAIAATAYGGGEQAFWASGHLYLPLTAAFAALVWLAASRYGKWLIWRPLVFMGRISYPLYLVHCALGFTIIRFGVQHGWTTLDGVIAAVLASLLAATLMHYFVEVPGERWSRAVLARRRPTAAALPDAAE